MISILAIVMVNTTKIDPGQTIWTQEPATRFYESSVLGNGRLGAMVFGGVSEERVVLNESTMWSGSPQDADREDAHRILPTIRQLLLEGKNSEAESLMQKNFVCKGPGSSGPQYGCYQVLGDLIIRTPKADFSDYRRELNLDTAVASISYRSGRTTFMREAIASAPDGVIAYRYKADKPGVITFDATLSRSERATSNIDGNDFILTGQLDSGNPSVEGVRFQGRLRVVAKGGKVTTDQTGIHVSGADEATLLVSAGTNMFEPDFQKQTLRTIEQASTRNFEQIRRNGTRNHQRYYRRVSLTLPSGPSAQMPTLKRLEAMKSGEEDPSLATLYFNFGRYLLISGSRPDSPLPTNLQGIWAEETRTPWNGDFHLDVNVQMNYWPAEVTNLADCHRPLLKFIPKLVSNGEKTAKAYYDARGWVAHVITNPWHFTSPGESSNWGSFCGGGAWLCEHLWDHYAFTKDKKNLREVYPTLKGAALFFMDMLVRDPKTGWYMTSPSNSPENSFIDPTTGKGISNCMGPTMDMQLVRELFGNVISASKELSIDEEFRRELISKRAKLAPTRVGKHGQIMEWLEDYEEQDVHHRHVSNLYGLYPATEISMDQTPELAKAAKVSLQRRGDDGVGWCIAYKACLWSRLHEGEKAWTLLKLLLNPVADTSIRYDGGGGAYPNLLDACPPFQIDGNFGGAAAVAEMLIQSREGEVKLLPALPKSWKDGEVKGLCMRGGQTVDFKWKNGKVTEFKVRGPGATKVKVRA